MFPSREEVERIKNTYKSGIRVKLNYTSDTHTRLVPGDTGTVRIVDDIGTVHITWDNGSSLGMVLGEDSISII